MRHKGRFLLTCLFLLALLLAVPIGLTWREVSQERCNRDLVDAVRRNDPQTVVALLEQGADANARDRREESGSLWTQLLDRLRRRAPVPSTSPTVLVIASELPADNTALLKALLDHGARVNVKDGFGNIPMRKAIDWNRPRAISLLLDHGLNVNERLDEDDTPLNYAAVESRTEAIKALLARGAKPDLKDKMGRNALILSVYQSTPEARKLPIIRALLACHVDVNTQDALGHTALFYARIFKESQIAHLLIQAGAKS